MLTLEANENNGAVRLGKRLVGDGHPCFIIAEIGINHNGDIDLARRLISVAVAAGCDAVKFQKRTVDVVYTPEELAQAARKPVRHHQRRPEARPRIRPRRVSSDRPLLPRSQDALVRLLLGRRLRRFHRSVRPALLQDRLRLADRRQPAAPHPLQGQAHHPLHRHEHPRRDRPRGGSAGHRRTWSCCTPAASIRPTIPN